MINYFSKWCKHCNLPLDAEKALIDGYALLTNTPENAKIFNDVIDVYANDVACDFAPLREQISNLAKKVGSHEYTAYAVMYVCMNIPLKAHYEKKGYPLDIYNETIKDVSFHMRAVKLTDGVWGTYTAWHSALYKMEIFGFGRLQFQPIKSTIEYHGNGFDLVKDETYYLNIHIPRTETPLDETESLKSIKKGVEFFKDKYFNGGKVLFHCQSWLLFDKHYEMLKPTSNILKFMKMFTIIDSGNYPDYNQLWRLFDKYYTGNPDDLPADSSLRREYIAMLKRGEPNGWGRGVFYSE